MLPRRLIPFAEPGERAFPGAMQPLVVQVGRDRELLRLRAKIIRSAGFTVHSVFPDEVTAELGKGRGRVWVFCHTLEFCELALLAVAIRNKRPSDKLLKLTGLSDHQQPPGLFDELMDSVRGVDELLRVVKRLAEQSALTQ